MDASQPAARDAESPLTKLAFLEGIWVGDGSNGYMEETWSSARGGNMLGMFRWLRPDDSPVVLELVTMTYEDGEIYHRLRHHDATLTSWEPKDAPMELRLIESGEGRLLFKNEGKGSDTDTVEYKLDEDGRLLIVVEFPAESGRAPLVLPFKRSPADG